MTPTTTRTIEIGSRVRLGKRVGVVMAISATLARVEWDDGNCDLVVVSKLVGIADEVKQPEGA